jgi:hypothetical protein
MDKIYCPNCEREVFGFWKYPPNHACSLKCFRQLVADGLISTIPPYTAFPELDILPPRKFPEREQR